MRKLDGTKSTSNQWWSNGKCWREGKKHNIYEQEYENGKYLESIIDDSTIICNEFKDAMRKQKPFQQVLIKRKLPEKRKIFMFYLHFY